MPTRPDLRGNLYPPTLELFCLFRFRVPRTGRTIIFDETPLEPHYEAHTVTFFFKTRPQTDSFGTRGWRGRRTWLWTARNAGNPANVSRGDGRAREDGDSYLHRGAGILIIEHGYEYASGVSAFR